MIWTALDICSDDVRFIGTYPTPNDTRQPIASIGARQRNVIFATLGKTPQADEGRYQ